MRREADLCYQFKMRIRYYISGHGLGHASRSCQIINALRRRHPGIAVEVVSDAQAWFLADALDPSVALRRQRVDIGVLQRDSLIMQEEETLRAYREFLPERRRLVASEAASLRAAGVDLVAADIPAAAFAAAAEAGVPAVAISNFSWDWIYEGLAEKHPGYGDVVMGVRRDYELAERLLRLPFAGKLEAFRRVEDIPLVARRARRSRHEVRQSLGIADGLRIGLISFGGFGLEVLDLKALGALRGWVFVRETRLSVSGANSLVINPGDFYYPDLVAAADAVITKPGYGIVSEAIANDTPVLYTSRGDFREQALLVEGLRRYARSREIDNDQLREGRWGDDLEALLALPEPAERLPSDGEKVAADRLAELAART